MNSIHPSAIISGEVTLGDGNTVGAFVVITGPVTIGDDNWIGTGAAIGPPPEVRSWKHPSDSAAPSSGIGISIGSRNVIREYAQIHQGWKSGTYLGDGLFIMNQAYVAHDCVVGDSVTLASSVLLAGHVQVGEHANLGLGSAVHQGRYIGPGAMVGMGAVVTKDIPPFAKAFGNPATLRGVNSIGMSRRGIDEDVVVALASAYEANDLTRGGLAGVRSHESLRSSIDAWLDRPIH